MPRIDPARGSRAMTTFLMLAARAALSLLLGIATGGRLHALRASYPPADDV